MVAYGWKAVANVWALAIAVAAVAFWIATKDDPQLAARRRSGAKPQPLRVMLEPLKNVQVWRFSLYYFFVFGAFVALARAPDPASASLRRMLLAALPVEASARQHHMHAHDPGAS
jgi:hypothetical protein